MSSQVSAEKLGNAILQSVEHGVFPQDEDVASASVPPSALPKLLEIVGKAKEDTKVRGAYDTLKEANTCSVIERSSKDVTRSCFRC